MINHRRKSTPVVGVLTKHILLAYSSESIPAPGGLLIGQSILKSRMKRVIHVRFREELGVKLPLLT